MTRTALVVAHGQPSDPAPAEAEMSALGAAVARHLPGWRIGAATLAGPGALEAAVKALDRPQVFPFFLSDGYFTRSVIPRRLTAVGLGDLPILTAFGLRRDTHVLAGRIALGACRAQGWDPSDTTLILAAHGSAASRASAEATMETANHLRRVTGLADIRCGFIEEPPFIAEVFATAPDRTICLPLFAARWGHVSDDLPAAVRTSGYQGVMLDPIGTHPDVPAQIAAALRAG